MPGTSTIIGTVLDAHTELPIGGAMVSIAGGGLPAAERVMADADGQFVFHTLPKGTYHIEAKRAGYLDGAFGRRRPEGAARPIQLGDDERRADLTIPMFKPGAIIGSISDEAGDPLVKVHVAAYRRTYAGGRPRLNAVDTDTTDDRGLYRIGRLVPGDYVIAVRMDSPGAPSGGGTAPMVRDGGAPAARLPPAVDGTAQTYPTTYYPAGENASQATVISVAAGESRRSVDVQLRPMKALTVSGTASGAGGPAGRLRIQLITAGEDEIAGDRVAASIITSADGSFTVSGVPSGTYVLRALVSPQGARASAAPAEWAEQIVAVGDKDVADISLFLRPALRVSGRFESSGSAADSAGAHSRGLAVALDPANGRYGRAPAPVAAADPVANAFSMSGVLPGRYLVRVSGDPSGWALKSVMYQGRDVSLTPFDAGTSDVTGIVVIFTDQPTALGGNVLGIGDDVDARVLVFPQDPRNWVDFGLSPRSLRALTTTGSSGAFETRGLPPGDYFVVAVESDAAANWLSPAFLQAAARVATKVRLSEGDRQTIDVTVVEIR